MNAIAFDEKYARYLKIFNGFLNETIAELKIKKSSTADGTIVDAMEYAVADGGKRVRPVLCLAVSEMLGGKCEDVKEFAVALEFIHSYSLVHDDLPAMDNDDYRRGKLATHKKYGEAFGVLAGDALLNYAFEICLAKENFDLSDLKAARIIAKNSGIDGMVYGQALDLINENNVQANKDILYEIYENKTSRLIESSLLVASVKNGGAYYEELKEIGKKTGIMFQITDDVLDEESTYVELGKTPHKDKEEGKMTSVAVFGLNGAKKEALSIYEELIALCDNIPNSDFLKAFIEKLYYRKK